jgi:hypothetical protein
VCYRLQATGARRAGGGRGVVAGSCSQSCDHEGVGICCDPVDVDIDIVKHLLFRFNGPF